MATISTAGLDGPTAVQVTLRVTDNGALSSTDTAAIEVRNVAPALADLTATTIDENGVTMLDDAVADVLTGSAGRDWFLFNPISDQVTDQKSDESAN